MRIRLDWQCDLLELNRVEWWLMGLNGIWHMHPKDMEQITSLVFNHLGGQWTIGKDGPRRRQHSFGKWQPYVAPNFDCRSPRASVQPQAALQVAPAFGRFRAPNAVPDGFAVGPPFETRRDVFVTQDSASNENITKIWKGSLRTEEKVNN